MKKFILMFATLCLITFSANAQTKKGTVLLGAGSEFSSQAWTNWMLTPKIGYFIQDGLAIGAESPEEIAIAVVAEIIANSKGVDPDQGSWRQSI